MREAYLLLVTRHSSPNKEEPMAVTKKIGRKSVKIFRIKNRKGYAALCDEHLTEGSTENQALDRMVKALARTERKTKKKA